MDPSITVTTSYEKRDKQFILRGTVADETYEQAFKSVPTFAQFGAFTGSCVVRYLSRDWSTQGGNE